MPFPTTNATQELPAVNQILASVGQAPVTTLDQTNPDVAIAYDTLLQVSREVQAEGWSFNIETEYEDQTNSDKEYVITNDMLQVDLSSSDNTYSTKNVVRRNGKLYDKYNHTHEITDTENEEIKLDVVWKYDWVDLPVPIQDYIVSRAAAIVSSRIVGDGQQYQILQQKEMQTRAIALEYECNQGDYTFFGHPVNNNYYKSYQPYHALSR
tara:strand:+ start:557 stop:1186 length:630 start_codon:yes stop_codon:yes gene_type:complete